jgi:hypothetical protein
MTADEAKAKLEEFARPIYKELREKPHTPLEVRQAEDKIAEKRAELAALVDG